MIKLVLREITKRLSASSDTARLDAELLLMHILQKPRAFLYAHADDALTPKQTAQLELVLSKRLQGVPMAYLLGEREFWSLLFYVTPDTLIPRPETELLVELALNLLSTKKSCSVLELGTGTGAISVALASEKPDWTFLALDVSQKALDIAEKNINRHQIKNINLIQSNWFEAITNMPTCHGSSEASFDLIISNPPYLAQDDTHQHQGDLRFEPKSALLSGQDGLDDLNVIIQNSMRHLEPGGILLLEHGYEQAKAVKKKLHLANYKKTATWKDSNHLDRVSGGWKSV
ncbi:MAG: peptide chain release factor N(5)-glutamine methyltransferase [Legionella sp.]|nr:peptide chain release factor N(5)-glutamine methyltransferase [Legionella sp.]